MPRLSLLAATGLVLVAANGCSPDSDPSPPGEPPMEYEISVDTLDPQPMLSIRGPVPNDSIVATIGERTGRIYRHLQEVDAEPAGPPFTRYHRVGEVEVDLEVGFPVAASLEGAGEIEAGQLPGGVVVSTVHRGSYAKLTEAGEALTRWLAANDREARGPNWEVYRVNAGTVADPSRYETDVIKPIR